MPGKGDIMAGEEYVKGDWRDAAGGTYPMRIKKKMGGPWIYGEGAGRAV